MELSRDKAERRFEYALELATACIEYDPNRLNSIINLFSLAVAMTKCLEPEERVGITETMLSRIAELKNNTRSAPKKVNGAMLHLCE